MRMGWAKAEQRSARSFSREYAAFSSMSGYRTAPVSRLYYRGMLPDLVFQKSLNTVTKRDHIRIWHYGDIDGEDVWLGAATHDSGITFRATAFQFSHRIDPALDVERATVVNDLAFAGCSAPARSLMTRRRFRPAKMALQQRMAVLPWCLSLIAGVLPSPPRFRRASQRRAARQ